MSHIPFDPKELEIVGYQKGFNPALPGTPLFKFPIPAKDNYKALKKYQKSGRWLKDYEADEQGKLPADLKRGVLSQDGLYDLLQDASDVLEALKEIR